MATPYVALPQSLTARASASDGRFAALARKRRRRLVLLGALAAAMVGVTLGLFVHTTDTSVLRSPGKIVTAVGIVVGLLATNGVCLMLLLAARIPFVDATLGHDRALRLHGQLGKYVVLGLLGHGLLVTSGYALRAAVTPVTMLKELWSQEPDIRLAVLGLGLFVVVGASSLVAVRRRYPYEFWFGVHLTTYVAVAAAVPHQFSIGGLFSSPGLQRLYWMSLYLITVCALLAFRVVLPLITTLDHGLRVTRAMPVGADAVSIELTGRRLDHLGARAGQFMMWRFVAPGLWWHAHPFSLSAAPTSTTLRLTAKVVGDGTRRISTVRPGTRVTVAGPYGVFSDAARTRARIVLIGAGAGIAPVRALLETTPFAPGEALVVLRASTAGELYHLDEVTALAQTRGAVLITLVGPRAGASWVPQAAAGVGLVDLAPWVRDADVYVCGPASWMDAVLTDARSAGVPAGQLHAERFAMG